MEHNDNDEVMVHEIETSQCASAMVEIKIKTLDSQTYTLSVDKCVPVPTLKEQVASVTGVVTEQQRLICRGKVLKDDQLLSAYHVEDGHTLHLVVRQPIPPVSESSTGNAAADPALSGGDSQGNQRSRVVVGSFNIAEQADGGYSHLGQILSAVLGSLGISNTEGGIEGIEAMGPLPEGGLSRNSGPSTARDSSRGRSVTTNTVDQTSTPLTSSQPAEIPDSLTTISEYLNNLRREFAADGSNANNLQDSEISMGNVQDSGSTRGESRILRPSHLAEVLQSTRQLLIGEVTDCLSDLSRQLEDHVNVTDPSTRRLRQSNIVQSGSLLENLGILLLELGHATTMLRLGQTPDDAVVDAGPAVFLSPAGQHLLPSHFSRLGSIFRSLQEGTTHSSSFAGQSLASASRNIEIRIRTGSWMPSSGANPGEESITQQTPGQPIPSAVPSMTGPSEIPRNHVALVIPIFARYQQATNPPVTTASTETNEAVTNAQVEPPATGTEEGNFISSVLQQIMPFISQNASSSNLDEASGRDNNISRQASSGEEEGVEQGDSSRRPEPPSPPESKRQKRD